MYLIVVYPIAKEIKLLDITYAAGVEKLDKEEREVMCVYLYS